MESQNCELFVTGERKGGHNNFIEEKESVKIQEFIRERVYNNFLLREREEDTSNLLKNSV